MSGLKLRSLRLKDGYSLDSLTNALTGQGTGADPRMANAYARRELTEFEIAAAYDGSGMMAKVIDIPALDMVREWRNWQAEAFIRRLHSYPSPRTLQHSSETMALRLLWAARPTEGRRG